METNNFSGDSGDTADLSGYLAQHEALEWLENNENPYAFAGNRFEDTASAVEFVRGLYDCGATQVLVSGIYDEPSRIEEEGGPYADMLVVALPADNAQREAIMQIYRTECSEFMCNEGDEDAGIRGDTLTLWWD